MNCERAFQGLDHCIRWCIALVTLPNENYNQRTADVSFALMDIIDICISIGIIEKEDDQLPDIIEKQLAPVYSFLGDRTC